MENQMINSKPKFSVVIQSNTYKNLINNTLGDKDKAQRFIASISSAVATNPSLQECDSGSILSGALLGEALNLSPSPVIGDYYLVPYKNSKKGTIDAQFQIGYKGYIHLAMRSGQYKDIDVIDIKEGEFLGRDEDTGKFKFKFISNEEDRLDKPTIGYMAYFELLNGFRKTIYITKKEMEQHANTYSKAFNLDDYKKLQQGLIPEKDMWKYSSFWYKSFDSMSYKTCLRQLLSKWGILSIEMQEAITKDMASINEDGSYDYVDNDNIIDTEEKPKNEEKENKKTKLSDIDV